MMSKSAISGVLDEALATGGDFAEVFLEDATSNGVEMLNGVVEKAVSGVDHGAGVRIFTGVNAIYAYTNDTSRENLTKVARAAAAAIRGVKAGRSAIGYAGMEIVNAHPVEIMPENVLKKDIVALLREASGSAFDTDPLITQTNANYSDIVQNVLIANSDGLWAEDSRVRTRVAMSAVASNESEKQTGSFSPGASRGFEFCGTLDIKKLAREAAETAVTMLKADYAPGGRMPVVIENGFGGVIFHEACGHSLEATSVARGASVFCGKMGQKIASDIVTAVDDGTLPNEWGSMNIDDEGVRTRRTVLIENGVLKSYMIDRLNGIKMGAEPTGSARRESYKYAPTSRMYNTFICPGNTAFSDMIASVEYGLYAKKMGGGSVMPATGEFNFAVLEGYMIRNGRIAEPVRGATLIGKGSEVLLDIDMISDNLECAQGVCGSISGGVPTNIGQPALRVREITVGGR